VSTADVRKAIVDYLRRELIGPAPGFPAIQLNKEEILRSQDPPRLRYSAGILFPKQLDIISQSDTEEKEIQDIEAAPPDDSPEFAVVKTDSDLIDSGNPIDQQPETDVDVNLTNQYLPSAMGLSALIEMPRRLVVKINCAQYQKCD